METASNREDEACVEDFDLVIANGSIIDGTGRPQYRADLGIHNGRLAAMATPEDPAIRGRATFDASDMIVAPGFIDTDSHADWALCGADRMDLVAPRSEAQPAGIRGVVVSGEVVVRDGQLIPGVSPGRILRRRDPAHCQPDELPPLGSMAAALA